MDKKKRMAKKAKGNTDVEFSNDQLGENPAQGRIIKESEKRKKKG